MVVAQVALVFNCLAPIDIVIQMLRLVLLDHPLVNFGLLVVAAEEFKTVVEM
jgi:hypothetical protein|tara:strand:- start:180 stop:335 length:156 start_codon:yes stop_codon:yes gene_type:complete